MDPPPADPVPVWYIGHHDSNRSSDIPDRLLHEAQDANVRYGSWKLEIHNLTALVLVRYDHHAHHDPAISLKRSSYPFLVLCRTE